MDRLRSFLPVLVLAGAVVWLQSRSCVRAEEPRPAGRVSVDPARISTDDGDSVFIRWPDGPPEAVRLLGIDTPEVMHLDHDIPYTQPFGEAATGFLKGCLAVADRVELLRSGEQDPHGRTLGYLYVNGRNYSVLVVAARLAVENVSFFGDNGLPEEARAVVAAAKAAGPVPFEPPHHFRTRMRKVSQWMKEQGTYPK